MSALEGVLGRFLQAMTGGTRSKRGFRSSKASPGQVPIRHGIGGYLKGVAHAVGKHGRMARWAKAGRNVGRGVSRTLGLKSTGKAAGAIGMGGSLAAGAAGAAVSIAESFLKARDAVHEWTESSLAYARQLGENSGSQAMIAAQREVGQIFRDMERGERTAGSTGRLMEAEAERKEQENKIGIVVDNAKNEVLTLFNKVMTPMLEAVNIGIEGIIYLVENIPIIGARLAASLRGEDGGGAGTLDAAVLGLERDMRRRDAAARDLMDRARAAAGARAAPAGGVPFPRPPGF
jgi:hypothetical protein